MAFFENPCRSARCDISVVSAGADGGCSSPARASRCEREDTGSIPVGRPAKFGGHVLDEDSDGLESDVAGVCRGQGARLDR